MRTLYLKVELRADEDMGDYEWDEAIGDFVDRVQTDVCLSDVYTSDECGECGCEHEREISVSVYDATLISEDRIREPITRPNLIGANVL